MQLIADILKFNDNRDELAKHIEQTSIDWDHVVIIGSQHLMLPALYSQLRAKDLLPLIPQDLKEYLKEITTLNRGRNEILLKEAQDISEIFNSANIDHVFIKGTALIAGRTFKDHAERMIGDIDILVAKDQLNSAFDLLTQYSYTETVTSMRDRTKHRHLPRQISSKKYGAVELHGEVLAHKWRHLVSVEATLKDKRIINGIAIPSVKDCITITILTLQVNDYAHFYGYFKFKTIYDCLALNLQGDDSLLRTLSNQKYSQSFLHLSSVFFKELTPYKSTVHSKFIKRYFELRLQNSMTGTSVKALGKGFIYLHVRWLLLIHEPSYVGSIIQNKLGAKIR